MSLDTLDQIVAHQNAGEAVDKISNPHWKRRVDFDVLPLVGSASGYQSRSGYSNNVSPNVGVSVNVQLSNCH